MSTFPLILDTLSNHNWTLSEVASGIVIGHKSGRIFSSYYEEDGYFKIVGHLLDGYKLFSYARSQGLFQNYPHVVTPIKVAALLITAMNLQTVFFGYASDEKASSFERFSADVWNITPKALAIGAIGALMLDFPKQPMRAAACLASMSVSWLSEWKLLTPAMIQISQSLPWISRGYLLWEARDAQGWMVVDALLNFYNYSLEDK